MSSLLAALRQRVSELSARGPRWAGSPAQGDQPAADTFEFDDTLPFRVAKERVVSHWERWYVTALVQRHGGNLSQAARAVRMDRTHLRDLVVRHRVR